MGERRVVIEEPCEDCRIFHGGKYDIELCHGSGGSRRVVTGALLIERDAAGWPAWAQNAINHNRNEIAPQILDALAAATGEEPG